MFRTVTFLTLVSLQFAITTFHACVPNTQFFINGLKCSCNAAGRWSESSCVTVASRHKCQPGELMWQGCSRCVCQGNGQFHCNTSNCPKNDSSNGLISIGPHCNPFKVYYVNCSICVCPSTGQTDNVHCARDNRCPITTPPSQILLLNNLNKKRCLPSVVYLFPCLQCTCSDQGSFTLENCEVTCRSNSQNLTRCSPKTFYKRDCNVCLCPENMIPDDSMCTREVCNGTNTYKDLSTLRSERLNCVANQFTAPRCWYCECNSDGTINKRACLESKCVKFNADVSEVKETCYPGEMAAICTECFCFQNGTTHNDYCTKGCSYRSKLDVLNIILDKEDVLNKDVLKNSTIEQSCTPPNSIYIDNGKYCVCLENGIAHDFCVEPKTVDRTDNKKDTNKKVFNFEDPASEVTFKKIKVFINYNATCDPSTFVHFDCNTCFCSKNGTIDPKWCTYDDCVEKSAIHERQKGRFEEKAEPGNKDCIPGTVYNEGCNFCICPEKGNNGEPACTINGCVGDEEEMVTDAFDCEPLSYYEVDCNICYCTRDGKKNVEKCTKNLCEKSFLRTDTCTPGTLFSEDCDVCVCPPNGNKADKACAKHKCHSSPIAWESIYKFSHSIINNDLTDGNTSKLDLCFPGEEFSVGCHLCVCPEMGIRSYATCSDMLCDDHNMTFLTSRDEEEYITTLVNQTFELVNVSSRRMDIETEKNCLSYNASTDPERKDCTPGSMYIIRCRQCICPYFGNINHFCRPMDPDVYCEQAYPGIDYIPMGRRADTSTTTNKQSPHIHTSYRCSQPGRIMDACFICECENNTIVREHCFQNQRPECEGEEPTFLTNTLTT